MKSKENLVGAILGFGRIGKIHFSNLSQTKNVEIKYIYDKYFADEDIKMLEQLRINVCYNVEDIFTDEDVNFVVICSPTVTHYEYIKESLNAKKNIFCEKPLAANLTEAKELWEIVNKQLTLKFQIGFNRRWDKNFLAVKNKVIKNKLEDLFLIKIDSYDPEMPPLDYLKNSGGLFMDMVIHDFDMMRFISNHEISEVFVNATAVVNPKIKDIPDVDTAITSIKFTNSDALGVITNTRQAIYGYDQRIEVLARNGAVSTENEYSNMTIEKLVNGIIYEKPLHFFLERYEKSYQTEILAFLDCIINDKMPNPNVEDAYQAILVAYACNLSVKEKRAVKISELK